MATLSSRDWKWRADLVAQLSLQSVDQVELDVARQGWNGDDDPHARSPIFEDPLDDLEAPRVGLLTFDITEEDEASALVSLDELKPEVDTKEPDGGVPGDVRSVCEVSL